VYTIEIFSTEFSQVLLFYFLVNGDAIVSGRPTEKSMNGEIMLFENFRAMNAQALFTFDIIFGTLIGKWEMLKRCVP
jgi:hypothetical protein